MIVKNKISLTKLFIISLWFALITLMVYGSGVGLHYQIAPYLILCSLFIIFISERGLNYNNRIIKILLFLILLTFISSYHYFDHWSHHTSYANYLSYSISGPFIAIVSYHIVRNKPHYTKILTLLILLFFIVGIFRFFRAQSQLAELHANTAYYYVLMPLPLMLLNPRKSVLHIIILFISTILCILSVKRGAIIGIAIIWLIYLFFAVKSKNILWLFFLGGIVYFGLDRFMPKEDVLASTDRLEERFTTLSSDGGSGRTDIIQDFFAEDVIDNLTIPEIFIGNGFEATLFKYKTLSSMHNDFLEVFYCLGSIGLILLILLYANMLKKAIHVIRTKSPLGLAYVSLCVLFILFSFIGCNFNYYTLSAPLFLSLGVLEAMTEAQSVKRK